MTRGEDLVATGDTLLRDGDVAAAAELYRQAVNADPTSAEAAFSLGVAVSRLGDWVGGLEWARTAVGLDGDHVGARSLLGSALLAAGDHAAGVEQLRAAVVAGAPPQTSAELAFGLEKLGRFRDAEELLRDLLNDDLGYITRHAVAALYRHSAFSADLHHMLGRVLQRRGSHDEARLHYHIAKRSDPTVVLDPMYLEIMSRHDLDEHPYLPEPPEPPAAPDEADLLDWLRYLVARPDLAGLKEAAERAVEHGVTAQAVAEHYGTLQMAGAFSLSARLRLVADVLRGDGDPDLFAVAVSADFHLLAAHAETVLRKQVTATATLPAIEAIDLPGEMLTPLIQLVRRFLLFHTESGTVLAMTAMPLLRRFGRAGHMTYLIGVAHHDDGDPVTAERYLRDALADFEAAGDRSAHLRVAVALATCVRASRDARAAVELLRPIRAADDAAAPAVRLEADLLLAGLTAKAGDVEAARRDAEAAITELLDSPVPAPDLARLAEDVLADIAAGAGHQTDAEVMAQLRLAARQPMDDIVEAAAELFDHGDLARVVDLLEPIAQQDDPALEVLTILGQAYAANERWDEADDVLRRATAPARDSHQPILLWHVYMLLSRVARAAGRAGTAIGWAEQALDVSYAFDDPRYETETLLELATAHSGTDVVRGMSIAGRVYGGFPPDADIVTVAHECGELLAQGQYPAKQLKRLGRLVGNEADAPGVWARNALLAAEIHLGAHNTRRAETLAIKALTIASDGDHVDLGHQMLAHGVIGRSRRMTGRYEEARDAYLRSIELARLIYDLGNEAETLNRLGVVWRHLDRPDRAAECYERAIRAYERLGDQGQAAAVRSNMLYSLQLLGRYEDLAHAAMVMLSQADVSTGTGAAGHALRMLSQHIDLDRLPPGLSEAVRRTPAQVDSPPGTFPWIYEHLHVARTMLRAGEVEHATAVLEELVGWCAASGNPSIERAAYLEAGRALVTAAPVTAAALLRHAMEMSTDTRSDRFSTLQCRQLLLDVAINRGSAPDSIDELLEPLLEDWRQVRIGLESSSDRVALADTAVGCLHRVALLHAGAEPDRALALWDASRSPDLTDALIVPSVDRIAPQGRQPVTPPPDTMLLAVGRLGDRIAAVVKRAAEPAVVTWPDISPAQVDALMRTLHREMHVFHGRGSQTWTRAAAPLLAGIAEFLRADETVLVAMDPAMAGLPLHAVPLPDGTMLLDRCAVAYTPSFAVADRLRRRESFREPGRGLVTVGVAFPDEARAVAIRFGGLCLSSNNLGKEDLRDAVGSASLLHMSCHGQFDPNSATTTGLLLSNLQPPRPDNILALTDFRDWRLSCGMAVLSACETGLGVSSASDVVGLSRNLLLIGATTVLSTLWKVDDAATQDFMLAFYEHLFATRDRGTLSPAAALRRTQLAFAAGRPRHEWAGFALIGWPSFRWQEASQDEHR